MTTKRVRPLPIEECDERRDHLERIRGLRALEPAEHVELSMLARIRDLDKLCGTLRLEGRRTHDELAERVTRFLGEAAEILGQPWVRDFEDLKNHLSEDRAAYESVTDSCDALKLVVAEQRCDLERAQDKASKKGALVETLQRRLDNLSSQKGEYLRRINRLIEMVHNGEGVGYTYQTMEGALLGLQIDLAASKRSAPRELSADVDR